MKIILKLIGGLMLLALYQTAQADYVCRVSYNPNASSVGNYGSVTIFRHTEPDCGGVFQGSNIFCSKGADYGPCAVAAYQYSERSLLALYSSLVDAARDNTRVTVTGNWCVNGGYGCGAYVNFHGD